RDLGTEARHEAQDVALHTIIHGHDVHGRLTFRLAIAFVPDPGRLGPYGRLTGGNFLGQIEADETRPGLRLLLQGVDVEFAVGGMGDDRVGGALLAQKNGKRAGVDAADGYDAAALQPVVKVAGGAIVGRIGDIGLEGRTDRARAGSGVQVLYILLIGAEIADMRGGEGDDLSGIGGVGQDLLIAGERGIEADFAYRRAGRAEADAF